jgi:hypothetical protein
VRRPPAPRGSRSLTQRLAFRVLRVAFTVTVDDPRLRSELRWLDQSAIQPDSPDTTVAYDVRRRDGAYAITRDGVFEDLQFDRAGVLATLYSAVQRDALAAWPEGTAMTAVVGTFAGDRFAVVGASARERSRLAVALICAGAELEGDDLAILGAGGLTTYPRPIRVDRRDRLPPRAPSRAELPVLGTTASAQWALDLTRAGLRWEIRTGPVALVVRFDFNEGGRTRVSELSTLDATNALIKASDPPVRPLPAIRATAALVGAARCRRLWLGSLDDVGPAWTAMQRAALRLPGTAEVNRKGQP